MVTISNQNKEISIIKLLSLIFIPATILMIAYVTWKQKNIYIAMTAHIMGNCAGSIGLLITILNL